jgi:uncharacterized iron-regulated membrane protein
LYDFTKVFEDMGRLLTALLALLLLVVVGGGLYLLLADPKPEVKMVETAIPNDRFPS